MKRIAGQQVPPGWILDPDGNPTTDPAALAEHMHVREARDLVDYLSRFDITLSVMQDADALERIAFELAEDAAAENVRYMEVRVSPALNIRVGLSLGDAVEAPLRGLRRAEEKYDIRTGIIICGIRNMSPGTSMDLAELTVAFKQRGVIRYFSRHPAELTVSEAAAILDAISRFDRRSVYVAPRPERPFRTEVGAATGSLRVGLLLGEVGVERGGVHRRVDLALVVLLHVAVPLHQDVLWGHVQFRLIVPFAMRMRSQPSATMM